MTAMAAKCQTSACPAKVQWAKMDSNVQAIALRNVLTVILFVQEERVGMTVKWLTSVNLVKVPWAKMVMNVQHFVLLNVAQKRWFALVAWMEMIV